MNCKNLFNQSFIGYFTGYIAALILGVIGVIAETPALAQRSFAAIPPLQMAQSSSLTGSWRLVSIGETASPTVIPQATELTAEFSDGRLSGSGGCNRFMGGYQTQGEKLSIEPLASTFMACEAAAMNQETQYLRALEAAQRYELDNQGQLTIFYKIDQKSGVLRFTSKNIRGLWY